MIHQHINEIMEACDNKYQGTDGQWHKSVAPPYHEFEGWSCKWCGYPGNYHSEISDSMQDPLPVEGKEWCAACRSRGEVEAGIQWVDKFGELRIRPNPFGSEYVVDSNPLVPLWSIVICGICHGTGMTDK